MKIDILGLSVEELTGLMQKERLPAYRGTQIAEWVYLHGVHEFENMVNLPRYVREKLKTEYKIGRSEVVKIQKSSDGTVKLLIELQDGEKIETVGIPYEDRFSCCVSTQVGCPIGCIFCATGKAGFKRNLNVGEIIDQLLSIIDLVRSNHNETKEVSRYIDNVVFMGMGEPLLNYNSTIKGLKLINNELGIGARHLTVSTVGSVPGILSLINERLQINLAVSLHAPNDKLRRTLVPGMKKWSIAEIVESCREYIKKTNRRVTFEYCLIEDINDSVKLANRLANLLLDLNCHVNVIPCNPVSGLPFRPPARKTINSFIAELHNAGINVTQRFQRGVDIDAACGQLRSRSENLKLGLI